VFPAVASLLTRFITSRGGRRRTLHRLPRLSTRAGLGRESLARRTRSRMTENVAAVRAVPVPLSTAHLSTAVWGDVLVKLRVLQLTCSKSPSAAHQKHSSEIEVLRPTSHKTGHFGDVLPNRSLV